MSKCAQCEAVVSGPVDRIGDDDVASTFSGDPWPASTCGGGGQDNIGGLQARRDGGRCVRVDSQIVGIDQPGAGLAVGGGGVYADAAKVDLVTGCFDQTAIALGTRSAGCQMTGAAEALTQQQDRARIAYVARRTDTGTVER